MNRYENSIPRVVFGITAVAMTAITIGASVVMPAKINAASREPLLATSKLTTPGSASVVTGLARVDVVAVRETGSSIVPDPPSNPKRKKISFAGVHPSGQRLKKDRG